MEVDGEDVCRHEEDRQKLFRHTANATLWASKEGPPNWAPYFRVSSLETTQKYKVFLFLLDKLKWCFDILLTHWVNSIMGEKHTSWIGHPSQQSQDLVVSICEWWGSSEKGVYPKSHEASIFADEAPQVSFLLCFTPLVSCSLGRRLEVPGNLESEMRHWGVSSMHYRAFELTSPHSRFGQGQLCQQVLARAQLPPASADPHYHSDLQAAEDGRGWRWESRERGGSPQLL